MNNINKNKLVIIGIIILMIVVILLYAFSLKEQNTNNYQELEISENKIENDTEIKKEKIKVHIAGSVVNEGIIELEEGDRIADAIKEAGGTTSDANLNKINLAYKLQDGQKIYIPNQNEEDEQNDNEDIITNINETNKININTATQTELEVLPGIGPSTAIKIINYRNTNGKFKKIEDIKNVPGIGESKFQNIEEQITV